MADVMKTEKRLALLAGFVDEDDRTLNIPNPRDNVTVSEIRTLEPLAEKVIIGDKYGATFTRFKSAKIISSTYVDVDFKQ